MNYNKAHLKLLDKFPFDNYMQFQINAYRDTANIALKFLEPGSRVLDFGSGPCDKTAILQYMGHKCVAYDDLLDEWHLQDENRAKIIKFTEDSGIELVISKGGTLPFENNLFDMIMMQDVIEHLHNSPKKLLDALIEKLKPGGYLFITVPNAVNIRKRLAVIVGKTNMPQYEVFYWSGDTWRGHVREYVKDDLILLSEYLGVDLIEIKSTNQMLFKLPYFVRPLYKILTSIFTGWRDTWILVARKPQNWEPKEEKEVDAFSGLPIDNVQVSD
jgi:SAM-dependent methyltransferase